MVVYSTTRWSHVIRWLKLLLAGLRSRGGGGEMLCSLDTRDNRKSWVVERKDIGACLELKHQFKQKSGKSGGPQHLSCNYYCFAAVMIIHKAQYTESHIDFSSALFLPFLDKNRRFSTTPPSAASQPSLDTSFEEHWCEYLIYIFYCSSAKVLDVAAMTRSPLEIRRSMRSYPQPVFSSPLQMMAIFLRIHFLPIRYQHNHNIWHFFSHV